MSATGDSIVRMANQIAIAFRTKPFDVAVAATVDHIVKFWDPRMKALIAAHDGHGLNDIARAAVAVLGKA